ncbi:MAG TPA: acyltransferase [Rhizomicrobium sp.]|nr:acyltransferase [Rhizomicrobium sp.]
MQKEFSTYLDVVRFAAAATVVSARFTFPQFIAGVPYQGATAGIAVTIFFVLSGYVITYVADEKEHTLKQFAVSRLARVYSVALPAIILTLMIDFYLMRHGAGHNLPLYEYRSLWKYLPVFLIFGSEIAGFHAPVFGNGVFWSLSYEVWYYVSFAAFFYLRGIARILAGIAALTILGIPPLLYFPIWLLGACIYKAHQHVMVGPRLAAIGAIGTAIILVGLQVTGAYDLADNTVNSALNDWPRQNLHNSMNFPSHYIAGPLAAAHIFFVRYCKLRFLSGQQIRKVIVYLASFTFAIYLGHRPLMNFWAYLIEHNPSSATSVMFLACLVAFSCWCFGMVSERQKELWRSFFRWLLRVPRKSLA